MYVIKACGKRGFRSERDAKDANRTNGHPLRVYFCKVCALFHVAKRER